MSPTTLEKVTIENVAKELTTMSEEQVSQVYDFVLFLQQRHGIADGQTVADDEAWLYDDEETMQAEDALWEQTTAFDPDEIAARRKAVLAAIEAGETEPMFDEDGNFTL